MSLYEYKMLPAPTRAVKAKGVKTPEARFARAVQDVLNAQASEGWEYLRADTLPHEERQGLTGSATTFRTLLVFRRARVEEAVHVPAPTAAPAETLAPPVVAAALGPAEAASPQRPTENETTDQQSDEALITPQVFAASLERDDEDPPRSRG